MKKHGTYAFLAALLLFMPAAQAQDRGEEFDAFKEAAKNKSVLFRGRRASSYGNVHFNGTFYWTSPEFKPGNVCYGGKMYYDELMNIDACAHELLVRSAPGMPAAIVDRDLVTFFTIGEDRYENLSLAGTEGAKPGFYRVMLQSPQFTVYERMEKPLRTSTDYQNGAGSGYEDPNYRSNFLSYFSYSPRYWQLRDGRLKKISRRKALKLSNAK